MKDRSFTVYDEASTISSTTWDALSMRVTSSTTSEPTTINIDEVPRVLAVLPEIGPPSPIVITKKTFDLMVERSNVADRAALLEGRSPFDGTTIEVVDDASAVAKRRVMLAAEAEMRAMAPPILRMEPMNRQQRRAAERAERKGRR